MTPSAAACPRLQPQALPSLWTVHRFATQIKVVDFSIQNGFLFMSTLYVLPAPPTVDFIQLTIGLTDFIESFL